MFSSNHACWRHNASFQHMKNNLNKIPESITLPRRMNRGVIGTMALIKPTTIADFVQLDEMKGGKYQINVIVQQNVTINQPSPYYPAFVRLPKNRERCPVSGLSKSALSSLIRGANPKVESFPLKGKGASRGQRMIVTASLIGYLDSLNAKELIRIGAKPMPERTSSACAIPMPINPSNVPTS